MADQVLRLLHLDVQTGLYYLCTSHCNPLQHVSNHYIARSKKYPHHTLSGMTPPSSLEGREYLLQPSLNCQQRTYRPEAIHPVQPITRKPQSTMKVTAIFTVFLTTFLPIAIADVIPGSACPTPGEQACCPSGSGAFVSHPSHFTFPSSNLLITLPAARSTADDSDHSLTHRTCRFF